METNSTTCMVTMVSPLMISANNNEAVAGVIGMQMRYEKFEEFFDDITQTCHNGSCDAGSCASDVSCAMHNMKIFFRYC